MASKVTTMSQHENNIPTSQHEDHVNGFFELITQHCATRGYQGLKNICEENDDIKRQLTQKDTANRAFMAELAKQQSEALEKTQLLSQIQVENKDLKANLAKTNEDYEDIQRKQEQGAGELTRLYQQETTSNGKIAKLKAQIKAGLDDVKRAQDMAEALTRSLENKEDLKKELEGLKSFSVTMGNTKDMQGKVKSELHAFFNKVYRFSQDFLYQDLDRETLSPGNWETIRQHKSIYQSGIILPASNSSTAKQMRLAAGLVALGRSLEQHVFQPFYLRDDQNQFVALLESLGSKNPAQEAHVRSVLLKAFPSEQEEVGEARADTAAYQAMEFIKLIIASDKLKSCWLGLKAVCDEARRTWMPLQRLKEQVIAYSEPGHPEEWQILPLPAPPQANRVPKKNTTDGSPKTGGRQAERQNATQNSAPATPPPVVYEVWPAFVTDGLVLCHGKGLTEEQVEAARDEVSEEEAAQRRARTALRQRGGSSVNGNGPRRRPSDAV